MLDQPAPMPSRFAPTRRSFFIRTIQGVHASIGATLAYILGSAVLAPSMTRREPLWLNAASLQALPEGEPQAITLRVARQDGATESVDRRVVFLVRSGDRVRALDFHVHHLGCRTRVNAETRLIRMPLPWRRLRLAGTGDCGPAAARARRAPDAPRWRVTSSSRCNRADAPARLARLADWLSRRLVASSRRTSAARHGLGVHDRQRHHLAPRRAGGLWRRAGDVLRAVTGARLRQRAIRDARTAHGLDGAGVARVGRQFSGRRHGRAPSASVPVRRLQGATRGDVADRAGRVPRHPRILVERLPAALGSEGVLGDDRHDQCRPRHAAGG